MFDPAWQVIEMNRKPPSYEHAPGAVTVTVTVAGFPFPPVGFSGLTVVESVVGAVVVNVIG